MGIGRLALGLSIHSLLDGLRVYIWLDAYPSQKLSSPSRMHVLRRFGSAGLKQFQHGHEHFRVYGDGLPSLSPH